jgi:hypothetical protein
MEPILRQYSDMFSVWISVQHCCKYADILAYDTLLVAFFVGTTSDVTLVKMSFMYRPIACIHALVLGKIR